jgi:hypothetical protein
MRARLHDRILRDLGRDHAAERRLYEARIAVLEALLECYETGGADAARAAARGAQAALTAARAADARRREALIHSSRRTLRQPARPRKAPQGSYPRPCAFCPLRQHGGPNQ